MKKIHSKLSKNELVCMCKEGWYVRLGQRVACLSEGGDCLKYLEKEWNRREEGKQKFGGGKLGHVVGALKWDAGNLFQTMCSSSL